MIKNKYFSYSTLKRNLTSTKGFTLIELLVVIGVIGILAALVTVSFTASQRQAKDTKRKSDLAQYRSVLESSANSTNGLYTSRFGTDGTGVQASVTMCSDLGLSSGACPEDPSHVIDDTYPYYTYTSDGSDSGTSTPSFTATKYVLWTKLEGSTNYWIVCSNGQSGTIPTSAWEGEPTYGGCPI